MGTTMQSLFHGASAFNQALSFNTSKVTNMYAMFSAASAFNQLLRFDTSKVTTYGMWGMFTGSSGRLFTTTFTDKASLKTALQAYDTDPTAAIATHGPIADL